MAGSNWRRSTSSRNVGVLLFERAARSCALLAACLLASGCLSSGESRYSSCPTSVRGVDVSRPVARVGAYYFDGWAGPSNGFHFAGLRDGPFTDREPLSGWSDRNRAAMQQQLEWAAAYGLRFFVFDWYFEAHASSDRYLNQALQNYRSLRDHRGVGFALLYVNTRARADQDDFVIPRARWRATAERWVAEDFVRRDYVRVSGRPVLFILDSVGLQQQLGGQRGVEDAFAVLNRIAREHGLPGVFIVGGIYVEHGFDWSRLPELVGREQYDALTQYAYPAAPPAHAGERPYRQLVASAEKMWDRFAATSPIPYIPDVMAGWDPRAWNERVGGRLFWYRRTPAQFERFVRDAIRWSATYPDAVARRERRPLLLIEAWNELGEGSYIVPTVGECHRYGKALARAIGR
jgi:hypothetical protein